MERKKKKQFSIFSPQLRTRKGVERPLYKKVFPLSARIRAKSVRVFKYFFQRYFSEGWPMGGGEGMTFS